VKRSKTCHPRASGDPGKNRNPSQAGNVKRGEIYAARHKRVSLPDRWEGKKGRKKNTGFFFLPGLKKGYFSILA
jgi:hypothetical protein